MPEKRNIKLALVLFVGFPENKVGSIYTPAIPGLEIDFPKNRNENLAQGSKRHVVRGWDLWNFFNLATRNTCHRDPIHSLRYHLRPVCRAVPATWNPCKKFLILEDEFPVELLHGWCKNILHQSLFEFFTQFISTFSHRIPDTFQSKYFGITRGYNHDSPPLVKFERPTSLFPLERLLYLHINANVS